jgi:DNA-binding NtrC family response regulator
VDKFLDYEACFMNPHAEGVFGVSEAMRQVETLLRRVADVDSPLLITGESGVGKEVAAKFVHEISTRANEPFVAVNCAAIPYQLIESQLFGHEMGAFTTLMARHHGLIEQARNGVLFLDEVAELPGPMQVKLLQLIQERTFARVGGEMAIKTGARIICATNTDLEAAATDGRFLRDLYDLIGAIHIAIPPLRDRSNDILPLAHLFMREFSEASHRDIKGFTAEAEQALLNRPWPRNVRELRNRIERAVALSQAPRIDAVALGLSEAAAPDARRLAILAEVGARAERQDILSVLRRRFGGSGPDGFGTSDPGSGGPLAPTPVTPDRPKHGSGGAAAHVEVTPKPPPDPMARRTVLPGKGRG